MLKFRQNIEYFSLYVLLIASLMCSFLQLSCCDAVDNVNQFLLDAPMDSGIVSGPPPNNTNWTNVIDLGIYGHAWMSSEMPSPYSRLPKKAESLLCNDSIPCASKCPTPQCEKRRCAVYGLSQTSTGFYTRFTTTQATQVHVRFRMKVENGDWLWPLNGHSGVDIYVQDDATNGSWRWATSSGNNRGGGPMAVAALNQPGAIKKFTATLGVMSANKELINHDNVFFSRNFTLYLPSRGSVLSVEVGVAPGILIKPLPPPTVTSQTMMPIAIYGTSILHAAAVGRAGMVYSSQMERYLGRPVLNLGFSGHGLMQIEVGKLLSEINTSLFILDCEYNMVSYIPKDNPSNYSTVSCLTHDFIKLLRTKQPKTPILLIEGHDATKAWRIKEIGAVQNGTRNGYRSAFNQLLEENVTNIYYLNGSGKLGGPLATDFEAQIGAVGGVHVSDFAFTHFSQYIGDYVIKIFDGTAQVTKLPLLPVIHNTNNLSSNNNNIHRSRNMYPIISQTITNWVEAKKLGVEGIGWPSELPIYGRLPQRAKAELINASLEGVWNLSECSSGVLVRFGTNATNFEIHVQRDNTSSMFSSVRQDDIFAWNGRFGIDLYSKDEATGKWRWFETSAGGSQKVNETINVELLNSHKTVRHFTIYFPTYVPITSMAIGTTGSDIIQPYEPHKDQKPILIWGSSIVQGGVVQNAGMTWPVALGRILDREILNFGFSGMCQMQTVVAKYLLELKPTIFVVDCLPNMNANLVEKRALPVFQELRNGLGPDVPIVVLEGHTYSNAWILPQVQNGQQAKRTAQHNAFEKAKNNDPNIFYVKGNDKLQSLGLGAYDATAGIGVHPTNIPHLHIAQYVAKQLKHLL